MVSPQADIHRQQRRYHLHANRIASSAWDKNSKKHVLKSVRPPKGRHCMVGRAVRLNTYSRPSNHRPGMVGASSMTTSRAAVMVFFASGLARIRKSMRSLHTSPYLRPTRANGTTRFGHQRAGRPSPPKQEPQQHYTPASGAPRSR